MKIYPLQFLPPKFFYIFYLNQPKSVVHKDASVANTTEKLLVYRCIIRPPSFGPRHPISDIKGPPRAECVMNPTYVALINGTEGLPGYLTKYEFQIFLNSIVPCHSYRSSVSRNVWLL